MAWAVNWRETVGAVQRVPSEIRPLARVPGAQQRPSGIRAIRERMAGSLNYNAMVISCGGGAPCSGVPLHVVQARELRSRQPRALPQRVMDPKVRGISGFGCEGIGVDSSHAMPAGLAPFAV